jgi:GTP:adenosylcobinamide-phosphate guanylyltransferase
MSIITIEVDDSELVKLNNYVIVGNDVALKSFLTRSTDLAELSDYELSQIVDCCKEAITENAVGVNYDVELGRSPQTDHRTYTLMGVSVVDDKYSNILVKDMIDYINNYKLGK